MKASTHMRIHSNSKHSELSQITQPISVYGTSTAFEKRKASVISPKALNVTTTQYEQNSNRKETYGSVQSHNMTTISPRQFSNQQFSYREEENEKLNTLIAEYRRENERCSQKINELQ